ncbi:MAG: SpoIIE family protein phosphatase [Deltaproteobacteria bacterium]|jgi:PAS domain S-box-containing protein|nr:SpoIIE family protein phosphatase [Deltaproteobacteria bacterium]
MAGPPWHSSIHLERLFDVSIQLLCVASTDGYFKRLNPAWERTLGFSIDELLSRPILDFVHPSDRDSTQHELKKIAEGLPFSGFENRYRCRNGSYRRLAWLSATHDDGVIYAAALDISAPHSAVPLLSRIIDSTPDAMLVTKNDGTISLANRLCEQLFLYSREDLIGNSIDMLIPKHLRNTHESHRRKYMESPEVRPMNTGLELLAVRADGVEFPAEISLGPLKTDDETFVLCAIRDVTARKESQDELRRAEIALNVSERRLSEQEAELFAAERIQMRFQPKAPPVIHGYDIASRTLAAEFTAGDLHDFLPMGADHIGLVVGDVTGHGFSASLLMASTRAYLRALAEAYPDPCELITHVHTALYRELEPERFVSLILAKLDFRKHSISYVNAGHSSGYVFGPEGDVLTTLDSTTFPVATLPEIAPQEIGPIYLREGQLVLLMTDGLYEARSETGEDFGLERVLRTVRDHQEASAVEIIDALHLAVRTFTARVRPEDDITIVIVKRGRASSVLTE